MPINKNHEFEDLDGVKCSIVERNASKERVEFVRSLLAYNGYKVVVVVSPPPKVAMPAPKPVIVAATVAENSEAPTLSNSEVSPQAPPPEPPAETFTVGVTDVMFNPTNAIFGRLLHTPDGHVVTLAYWEQKEKISHDEVPYFESKA